MLYKPIGQEFRERVRPAPTQRCLYQKNELIGCGTNCRSVFLKYAAIATKYITKGVLCQFSKIHHFLQMRRKPKRPSGCGTLPVLAKRLRQRDSQPFWQCQCLWGEVQLVRGRIWKSLAVKRRRQEIRHDGRGYHVELG